MLAQINEIDGQLEQAVEAYNLASVKLDRIQGELTTNSRHLVIARKSLKHAQTHLSERLVALYVGGGDGSSLEVLLGARSIDDLLNRLDAVERVSKQDTRVLSEVKSFRAQVKLRRARLQRAKTEQVQVVADRAAQRQSIEGQLAERNQLLASIKDQIASLEAAERLRQERAAAEARARLSRVTLQAQDQSVQSADSLFIPDATETSRARAAVPVRRGGRDRDAVPGRPVRLGRLESVRIRLLRLRLLRVLPDGRVAATPRGLAVQLRLCGLAGRARAR